jgi:hypothetical protein
LISIYISAVAVAVAAAAAAARSRFHIYIGTKTIQKSKHTIEQTSKRTRSTYQNQTKPQRNKGK